MVSFISCIQYSSTGCLKNKFLICLMHERNLRLLFKTPCTSGKKVRGRKYPWGTVNIEDPNHCDFLSLRSLVLAHHMHDLKDVTSQVHYEKYRCEKLTSLALQKEVSF